MKLEFMRSSSFWITWFIVMMISVYDGFLVWRCDSVIQDVELNPIGAWLLHTFDRNVWPFIGAKCIGTIFACMFLQLLYRRNPNLGMLVILPIALFQLCLLTFLTTN